MIKIPDTLPVPIHPTMEIVDSSKIQAFQDCPRGFFFSYVLGLRPDKPNVHLDFGSAWHDAMEEMLLRSGGVYDETAVAFAFQAFLKTYREAFPDAITDPDRAPKNPEYAFKALQDYANMYQNDNFYILYTETAGMVNISDKRKLVVKLDSIVRDRNDGKVNSMEHKTTGYNSTSWRDKWSMMLQIESYTHLLYSMFPEDEVGKVIINGACFTKSRGFDGIRIPVYKSKKQMAAFLWNVNHWIDMIEWNYAQLAEVKPEDPVMPAFPINCSSCSKFGCRMGGICATFPNPLKFASEGISGYVVDFWDPLRENLKKSDNIIEVIEDGKVTIRPKTKEDIEKFGLGDLASDKPTEDPDFSAFESR